MVALARNDVNGKMVSIQEKQLRIYFLTSIIKITTFKSIITK